MRRRAWPVRAAACLTTAAFLLYLLLWGCPHYDLGDDVILMDAFFGAVGGTAETFNAHVLAPLTWILVVSVRNFITFTQTAAVSWRTETYDGFTIYQFLLP